MTRLAVSLALYFFGLCASAQGTDPLLEQARGYMAQRLPDKAYALLEPEELQRAQDPGYSYLLGIAAMDAGHVTRAIFALERAVALNPDDSLARAELARAYLLAGEPLNARTELRLARRGPMPAEAAAAIDRVLGAIDQEPVEPAVGLWRGYVEAFGGHDSNVNSATAAGQFALPAFGGVVFNLDRENRQRGDTFAGYGAGVGVQLPLTPAWELDASVNARGVHHAHADAQDNRQLDASAGASFTAGANKWSAALQTNQYDIHQRRYRSASGVSAQWQHTLDALSQATAFAQRSRLSYAQDAARDADRTVVGAGYARALGEGRQVVYGSVYRAVEDTRASGFDNYGHHAIGVRLGGEAKVAESSTLFAAFQYERRRYGGAEPFFDAGRVDRQADVTAGLHVVPAALWRITPQVTFVRADSNVVLYQYRRLVWQLAVRREFK